MKQAIKNIATAAAYAIRSNPYTAFILAFVATIGFGVAKLLAMLA